MPLLLQQGDITRIAVDAVVNAANTKLKRGGGVCGAIFRVADDPALQAECDALAPIEVGDAVWTKAYGLPAKYIIHTVGPIWQGGGSGEEDLLYRSYSRALLLAGELGIESIAFPLISAGIFAYPKQEALAIAKRAILDYLQDHEMEVRLVLFAQTDLVLEPSLRKGIERYVEAHRAGQTTVSRTFTLEGPTLSSYARETSLAPLSTDLDAWIEARDESFHKMLFRLIDAKGLDDVTVYKRANIDRKHFSKIRTNRDYIPSKRTAVALAIGLELSTEETNDFLDRAGYTLSQALLFDLIILYFITNAVFDVMTINEVLFHYDQILLGS